MGENLYKLSGFYLDNTCTCVNVMTFGGDEMNRLQQAIASRIVALRKSSDDALDPVRTVIYLSVASMLEDDIIRYGEHVAVTPAHVDAFQKKLEAHRLIHGQYPDVKTAEKLYVETIAEGLR